MKVVCQDARTFRLEDHENASGDDAAFALPPSASHYTDDYSSVGGADLVTLSYSLSMIVSGLHRFP